MSCCGRSLRPDVLAPTSHFSPITGNVLSVLEPVCLLSTLEDVSHGPYHFPSVHRGRSKSVVLTACVPDGGVFSQI